MPLVAFDSMITDEFAYTIDVDDDWADAMEAMKGPPEVLSPEQHAMYWLVTLAPAWSSCLYTFSDRLYEELAAMPEEKASWASRLLSLAMEYERLTLRKPGSWMQTAVPTIRIPDPRQENPEAGSRNREQMGLACPHAS